MTNSAVPIWNQGYRSTLDEFSATSRTLLGLSSGGIGLIVGMFKDSQDRLHSWPSVIALTLFLISVASWLSVAHCFVSMKLFTASEMWTEAEKKKFADDGEVLKWSNATQRTTFILAVLFTCYAAMYR